MYAVFQGLEQAGLTGIERSRELKPARSGIRLKPNVVIVGAGIGGLVLALELHRVRLGCRVYEAASKIEPLGVGVNLLPHATRILRNLGLESKPAACGVTTRESVFYNRFGQFIHSEPAGRYAGYDYPQFSLHRGDLQKVLLEAVQERLGNDSVITDHHCAAVRQNDDTVELTFTHSSKNKSFLPVEGGIAVACDGVHSAIRKQFYPEEGEPRYSGITMWRGVTVAKPFLTGASMARVGWFTKGKVVVYPIRNDVDSDGNQLIKRVIHLNATGG